MILRRLLRGGLLACGLLAVGCQMMESSLPGSSGSGSGFQWGSRTRSGVDDAQRQYLATSEGALAQSEQLVQAFYQLPYEEAIAQGTRYRYDHDRTLPVMVLDGYRTFVKGLRIETSSGRIGSIVIRSLVRNPAAPRSAKKGVVLFPSVLLLSEQMQLLADIKRPDFTYLSLSRYRDAMSATIPVPGEAQGARYLVIYVSPENRVGTFQYCRDGLGMVRFNSAALPTYEDLPCFAAPFSLEGRLELVIE